MPKITDPTNLARDVSVIYDIVDPLTRLIDLASDDISGSSQIISSSEGADTGVTMQALYSFTKEAWKNYDDLIRIPFPFISITKNQFDVINNWDFAGNRARYLVRDAGWSVRSGSANFDTQEWVGIVTLGSLGTTDQVYYQQSASNQTPTNFVMRGPVNQAIQTYSASSATTNFDKRGFTKLFVREWEKTYAQASIQDDLAVVTEEYTVYSLPLTNGVDLKITEPISASVTGSPYNEVTITFYSGSYFNAWTNGATYAAGTVVSSSDNRWYITNGGGGPTNGTGVGDDIGITDWVSYPGERQIGANWYVFNKIVDAGGGKNNSISEIYTRVQYELKQTADIDDGTALPASPGYITDLLLRFLGDTLITYDGVYVDNFQDADTNNIDFYDVSGTVRRFPFVATGLLQFNDNLVADPSASYYMFFTSVPSGTFGSASAVSVLNNTNVVISGSIAGSSSVSFTFDYDFNVQGGRTAGTDADVTVVAIGLTTAQYVTATSTIQRSKANNISLVAALERNYSNP